MPHRLVPAVVPRLKFGQATFLRSKKRPVSSAQIYPIWGATIRALSFQSLRNYQREHLASLSCQ